MTDADSHSAPRVALFQVRKLRRTFVDEPWWCVAADPAGPLQAVGGQKSEKTQRQ